MWTLIFPHHAGRTPTHGYEATREAAMAAFAKSWRQCGLSLRVFSEIWSGADPSPPAAGGGERSRGGASPRFIVVGRNLWLLGIWLEHVLKNIPFHDHQKEFTDKRTNAHVPELCLEH
jgi:hypothetical protein